MSDRANEAYQTATNAASTYCWEVQQAALEAVREAVERGEDKEDALMAYANDCETTIYTGQAWTYCLGSRNEDAYLEEIGEEPKSIEARACFAIMADVRSHPDYDAIGAAVEA